MLRFKRGDSVEWPAKYKVNGLVVDLTNYNVASQVRTKDGVLVCAFTIVKLDQTILPGQYLLKLTALDTAGLRPGSYFQDIQYSLAGDVRSTTTTPLVIDADQTQ